MSIKSILLLSILIAVDAYKASITRETPIPESSIDAAEGRWFGLATSANTDPQILCEIMSLVKGPGNNFTMYSTVIASPEANQKSSSIGYRCKLMENSEIYICDKGAEGIMTVVILDVQKDSYMAIDTAPALWNKSNGANGAVILLGRDKETRKEAIAEFMFSHHYSEHLIGGKFLNSIRTNGCP